jgi:hypothetical protein
MIVKRITKLKMFECAGPDCHVFEHLSKCSSCDRELYCCGECQKGDWKVHKLTCSTLKKLPRQLQSIENVFQLIEDINKELPIKNHAALRILEHLMTHVKQQFGDRVPGSDYRQRGNGEETPNYAVEIFLMIPLYQKMSEIHENDKSLSTLSCGNKLYPIYVQKLDLLKPWSTYLYSTNRIDIIDNSQVNDLLFILSESERNMGVVQTHRNFHDLAEKHFKRAITFARRYDEGELKNADQLCCCLQSFYELRFAHSADAFPIVEEIYNILATAYNPAHPKVLD